MRVCVSTRDVRRSVCTKESECCLWCTAVTCLWSETNFPWLSQPSCSFLQWGERLYRLNPPFCLPATDHQYSLLLFTPTRQHTAPPILQEGPNTDMLHVTRLVTRPSELQMSFDGERKQPKQPNTQEFSSLLFHSSLHSKLSFLFTVIDVVIVVVVLFFCFSFSFFSSSSESNKEKWTLDGLLKLCNVKAKQMCFCYLCL